MALYRSRYLKRKRAALMIKTYIFSKRLQKMRFKHMQRVVGMMQDLAKGYLTRQHILFTQKAVDIVRHALKQYIHRLRLYRKKNVVIITIQRFIRCYLTRTKQSRIIHILDLRRKQRIAQKVTLKIQSYFRQRYTCRRYRKLKYFTLFLQRWIRARFLRRHFLQLKYAAIWLQKHWRRMQAIHKVSNMRMAAMVLLEETRVWKFRSQELKYLKDAAQSWNELKNTWQIGKFTYRNGRTRCTRRIIGYDSHFDLGDVYPNQWMKTVINFSDGLKRDEKKSITCMALGAEHTILVDNSSNFYSFGSGDSGQLGHNKRQPLAEPTLMETMNLTIHASEATFFPGLKQPTKIISICCGRSHTLVLASSGRMYSWGSNK